MMPSNPATRKARPRMLNERAEWIGEKRQQPGQFWFSAFWGRYLPLYFCAASTVTLLGAVLQQDRDPNKQSPLADVQITATNALGSGHSTSDSSGSFSLTLPKGLRRRQQVVLQFRHKDYQPLDMDDFIGDKLYVARMRPIHQEIAQIASRVGGIKYSDQVFGKSATEADIGSAVKTFDVVNMGNTPCNKRPPCSPDGKWKARIGSVSLDAGEGNEFRNARVSCIAGPCPFTKIELDSFRRTADISTCRFVIGRTQPLSCWRLRWFTP